MTYNLPKGKYPYPLNFLASDGGTVDTEFIEGDPYVEPGSTNWYVLCLTDTELLDVMSLVDVGAPIAFPDDYNRIRTIFWQMQQFPNQIPPDSCMDLCAEILNCIETNDDIRRAIAQASRSLYPTGTTPEQEGILQMDVFSGQPDCDNDKIFGATTGLTDLLNQISEDIFEILVDASNRFAQVGALIEAIPGVGELPFDDILQFVEQMADDIDQAYESAYDTQLRDDFRCALFCIAVNNGCELTIEDCRDWFQGQIVASVTNTDMDTVINDIIANNWIGEQSVYVMHWLILNTIIFGGEILGIDASRLVVQISALFNDPDPDWAILCDDCGWTSVLDFTTTDFTSLITWRVCDSLDLGQWVDGTGLIPVSFTPTTCPYGTNPNVLAFDLDFTDTAITSVRWEGLFTKGGYSNQSFLATRFSVNDGTTRYADALAEVTATNYPLGQQVTINTIKSSLNDDPANRFEVVMRPSDNAGNGSAVLQRVTVTGTGTKPPEFP